MERITIAELWLGEEDVVIQGCNLESFVSILLLDAGESNNRTSQDVKKDEHQKVTSRSKKECPHPGCDKVGTHLLRHLRNTHKRSPRKAKTALQKFGLRKTKEKIGDKKRDFHVKNICPLPGCRSTERRIADHLTGTHKLKRTSTKYKNAFRDAIKAPVGKHIFTKLKEERLERKKLLKEVVGAECETTVDVNRGELQDEC